MTTFAAIAAVGLNGEVGRRGVLPWAPIGEDLRRFRERTLHKPVLMGRNTWESLPAAHRPLSRRANFVLTSRGPGWARPARADGTSLRFIPGPGPFFDFCRDWGGAEAMVIGGPSVWSLTWPLITRIYLTRVDSSYPGADAFFPNWPPGPQWEERQVGRIVDNSRYVTFSVLDRGAVHARLP